MVCEILDALCFDIVVTLFGSTVAVIIPLIISLRKHAV